MVGTALRRRPGLFLCPARNGVRALPCRPRALCERLLFFRRPPFVCLVCYVVQLRFRRSASSAAKREHPEFTAGGTGDALGGSVAAVAVRLRDGRGGGGGSFGAAAPQLGEAAAGGFAVAGLEVDAGAVHDLDHVVE
jgi:hypothetical protein